MITSPKRDYKKIETLTQDTIQFLARCGHMVECGIKYPRWEGRKYIAKKVINDWKYTCKQVRYRPNKEQACYVLAMQIFSGLRPEWVERNFKLGGIMKYLLVIMMLMSTPALSETKHDENWHVERWCFDVNNPINEVGFTEVVQEDNTRVDCLVTDYAIEFDWAYKYNEGISQALGYALRTQRRPGVVLIFKKPSDIKYWNRLQELILHYNLPIQTWKMFAWKYKDE